MFANPPQGISMIAINGAIHDGGGGCDNQLVGLRVGILSIKKLLIYCYNLTAGCCFDRSLLEVIWQEILATDCTRIVAGADILRSSGGAPKSM